MNSSLLAYFARRILYAAFVIWVAYSITFILLWFLPSDPVSLLSEGAGEGSGLSGDQKDSLREQFGYDRPPVEQYWLMLTNALKGDFGQSIVHGIPVTELLSQNIGSTISLNITALILALIIGIPSAVVIASKKDSRLNSFFDGLPSLFLSIPGFVLGLVLIQLFSFRLGLFPPFGGGSIQTLVLPAIALAIPTSAFYAQVLSQSLRKNLELPYIETLKAKGISPQKILFNHALHNASLPFLTMLGFSIGGMFAGSIIIETVFSRPGAGRLLQQSVNQQDVAVVQALVLIAAATYAIVNLLVDFVYPLADKRILTEKR